MSFRRILKFGSLAIMTLFWLSACHNISANSENSKQESKNAAAQIASSESTVKLQSLVISSTGNILSTQGSLPLTATGLFSDGTTSNLTYLVTWASEDESVLHVDPATGISNGVSLGEAHARATLRGVSASYLLTVLPPTPPLSMAFSSVSFHVPKDFTQQLVLTAKFADGSTATLPGSCVSWSSNMSSVASVNTFGRVSAWKEGSTTITATYGNLNAATIIDVDSTNLQSIQIISSKKSVNEDHSLQLSAMGTFTNNGVYNITDLVSWSSTSRSNASIDPATGLLTGLSEGSTLVTATYDDNIMGHIQIDVHHPILQSLAVHSASSVAYIGGTLQLFAVGSYDDGSKNNLTSIVQWRSNLPDTVSISPNTVQNAGVVTGISYGQSTITAKAPNSAIQSSLNVVSKQPFVYIANATSNGYISMYSVENKKITPLRIPTVSTGNKPQMIAFTPDGNYAYVPNYGDNTISLFQVNQQNGMLSALSTPTVSSGGMSPWFIAVDPTGNYLYSADVQGGAMSIFRIAKDGLLTLIGTQSTSSIGVSQPYGISFDSSGKYLYVLGNSTRNLGMYSINQDGTLTALSPPSVTTMVNPNDADPITLGVLPSKGNYLYVSNGSGSSSINMFSIGFNGILSILGAALPSTIPFSFSFNLHPNGRYAYATGKDASNTKALVYMYSIGPSGSWNPLGEESLPLGKSTENYGFGAIDPVGEYYVLANHMESKIALLNIDKNTGVLSNLEIVSTGLRRPMRVAIE